MTNIFALDKLTIQNLDSKSRQLFEVMFNPKSYQQSYGLDVSTKELIGDKQTLSYQPAKENSMNFELVFDDANVHLYPWQSFMQAPDSVEQQIDKLFTIAGYPRRGIDTKAITPKRLEIRWGRLRYTCILEKVTVNYNQFDRNGRPSRATLDTTFHVIDKKNTYIEADYQFE